MSSIGAGSPFAAASSACSNWVIPASISRVSSSVSTKASMWTATLFDMALSWPLWVSMIVFLLLDIIPATSATKRRTAANTAPAAAKSRRLYMR